MCSLFIPRSQSGHLMVVLVMAVVSLVALPPQAVATVPEGCPNGIKPLASVNLKAYLGRWYEIGASAGFKFFTESGLTCIQAEYSLINETDSGPTIRVMNSGIPLAPRTVTPLVRAFSANSTQLCRLLAPLSSVEASSADAIDSIEKSIQHLADALNRGDSFFAKIRPLHHLKSRLLRYIRSLGGAASKASERVSNLQQVVGATMQIPGPTRPAEIQVAIRHVEQLVRKIEDRTAIICQVLGSIEQEVAGAHDDSRESVRVAAEEIMSAVKELRREAEIWKSQSADVRNRFDDLSAAAVATGQVERQMGARRFPLEGVAVRDLSTRRDGALTVSFPFGEPGNYWIVALEGVAEEGYKAVLVYSCSNREFTTPTAGNAGERVSLWVLSRTPTLEQHILDRFLALAAEYGVSLTCSNSFIPTAQDKETCSY